MDKNIVLIGYMACGKGRTAREICRQTERFAIDTDDLIESMVKMKVKKIFKKYGEPYFRNLERKTGRWLAENVSNSVISTGGGFFMVPNLSDIGLVVYLHGSFEHIISTVLKHPNSVKKIKKRPLLNDLEAAHTLYEKRVPLYREVADIEVDITDKSTHAVAGAIVHKLGSI